MELAEANLASAKSTAMCRVCGSLAEMKAYQLRETMFRTFEVFDYQHCQACGSMQIVEVPKDLHRHYPKNYYSLSGGKGHKIVRAIRASGLRFGVDGKSAVGRLLSWFGRLPSDAIWLRACDADFDWNVLDVGCGRGDRLEELAHAGFRRLAGIDPFVETDIRVTPDVVVRRGTLEELDGRFDLVMLHHSLEHVPEPRKTLQHVARILSDTGKVLIRVPVMGKWAWRTYGTDWVQLDPPRHLYQFSEEGIGALAHSVGLRVRKVVFDSFEFQFYGSEQIRDFRVHGKNPPKLDGTQLKRLKKQARELNQAGDGDQACFVLSR